MAVLGVIASVTLVTVFYAYRSMLLVAICFLLVVAFLLREYLSKTRRLEEYVSKIPGPKPLPFVGNVLECGLSNRSLFQYLKWATKQYGPVLRFWIGSKLLIVLADPDSIEHVLGNNKHLNKSSLYDLAKSFIGLGLVVSKGEIYRKHRKIIAPTFQGQMLTRFINIFSTNIDILIDKLSHHTDGPEFDINPFFNLFALDIISESAMGVKVNAQLHSDSDYVKATNCMEDTLFIRGMRPWLHPDIIFSLTSLGRKYAKYVCVIQDHTKRVIEERKKLRSEEAHTDKSDSGDDSQDKDIGLRKKRIFLDYLLDCVAKGDYLTDEELQHEVDTIMMAGHETTASSLSYACWLLAKHQDVQERVHEEMRTIFGDSLRHSTMQDLGELKYLEQVIKETLRMFPPASAIARQLSEDVNTGKYIFPAGCEAVINICMLHRHPDYFPEPDRFDPDRFLPENCVGRHPYCYIPFSAGPRNCIGYKYAMLEMKATLSKLLRHFKILPPENPFLDLDLAFQIVTKSINGVRVRLEPRNFMGPQ